MPGVSRSSKSFSLTHCLPRVTPALLPVTVFFPPESAFMTVDLPVLGIPATIILIGAKIPLFLFFSTLSFKSSKMPSYNRSTAFLSNAETAATFLPSASNSLIILFTSPFSTRSHLVRT